MKEGQMKDKTKTIIDYPRADQITIITFKGRPGKLIRRKLVLNGCII